MKVTDAFKGFWKINDDGLGEDDYLDEEYEDGYEEEDAPKKRILSRHEDEETEPEPESIPRTRKRTERAEREERKDRAAREERADRAERDERSYTEETSRPRVVNSSKVSPMRSRRSGGGSMEVCVIRPKSMEEGEEIVRTIQAGSTVILNMEGLELVLAQRIIDFSGGACFALGGKIHPINDNIFVLAPEGVEISGDFEDRILREEANVKAFGTKF